MRSTGLSPAPRVSAARGLALGMLLAGAALTLGLASCTSMGVAPYYPNGRAVAPGTVTGIFGAVPPGAIPPYLLAAQPPETPGSTETYDRIVENGFITVAQTPLSTFSTDVDTAAYSNVRRFLNAGQMPPKDAVRLEEMINYFDYDYPQPQSPHPISVTTEVAECPWNEGHQLVRVGLKGRVIDRKEMPPRNFVFLVDVSGSMDAPNRLPLVKTALAMLVEQLTARDRVAIVTYAGDAGLALPSTPGNDQRKIHRALSALKAGGSTNGGEGIRMAYRVAREHLIKGGLNRVILATDGDFNVGVTSADELLKLIEGQRKAGVDLTVLGFGMGNLRDATMEKLADHGNGHYAYIDSKREAQRVFVEQGAALITIARDVKVQVEFNPRQVASYRLLGYENRLMKAEDFNNEKKDAGDVGAGHTVTALYEVVPAGKVGSPGVDPLRYQQTAAQLTPAAESGELMTVKVRYRDPSAETSTLLTLPVYNFSRKFTEAPQDFRFAAAVAAFGMLLRDSEHKGTATYAKVREVARSAKGHDLHGHRAEFVRLVETAERLAGARGGYLTYQRVLGGIGP
jgi:Ca-activated chloride channel family protein